MTEGEKKTEMVNEVEEMTIWVLIERTQNIVWFAKPYAVLRVLRSRREENLGPTKIIAN